MEYIHYCEQHLLLPPLFPPPGLLLPLRLPPLVLPPHLLPPSVLLRAPEFLRVRKRER